MKKIIIISGMVIVMSVLVTNRDAIFNDTEVYVKEVVEEIIEVEVPVPTDVIEQSKIEIDRISQELDVEESSILEDKEALKLEYEEQQRVLDTRLEAITEIRLSF